MGPLRDRKVLLAGAAWAVAAAAFAAEPRAADPLAEGFRDPPNSARPRVWWHWMNGNISQEGVDLDLAWMKRVGIGGFQNFDAALATPQVVDKRLAYMTPEWNAVFRHTAERADQLGLEMAIASSPGWSETGGPWVKPEQAMKKLVWSETVVQGGQAFDGRLKAPPSVTGPFQTLPAETGGLMGHQSDQPPLPTYYADAAVIAYPAPDVLDPPPPKVVSSAGPVDSAALADGDLTTGVKIAAKADQPSWLLFDYGTPRTIRSVRLATGVISLFGSGGLRARLEASDDAGTFRPVADLPFGKTPQQTTAVPATTARYFRILLDRVPTGPGLFDAAAPGADFSALAALFPSGAGGPPPFLITEAILSPQPRVNQFELKAGFGIAPDYYALEAPGRAAVSGPDPASVVNLTGRMSADGRLDWTAPKGRWIVLRLGCALIGTENHPATPEATGLEVDKLNKADVQAYMAAYLDRYAEILGAGLMGAHGVRALLNDSIEVGAQNWTDDMLAQFKARRGYDPAPWLPTLTGAVIGDGQKSDAFLYDFRKTLAELIAENHYAVVAQAAHARGLITYGEALEDNRPSLGDDLDMRRYADVPMAALWTYNRAAGPRPTFLADIRGAASVAHLYGQNLVAAESMTAAMAPWAFAPRDLKPVIDLEFALGVNRPVVHTSVHQPLIDKKPGLSLSIFGQYFNRNDTWAEQARPWVDYISRNAFMLQQGRFFADVAYFAGEEAPLTGLYGQHDTPDLPHGYGFDFINAEILNNRLTAQGDSLAAPTGARYRLLYLGGSSRRMTLATLQRIHDLVAAGAVVAGLRPEASPGLADDPAAFDRLADSLWTAGQTVKTVGLGKVIAVGDPDAALALIGLPKDFDANQPGEPGKTLFVHRKLPDGDLYYVDNRQDVGAELQARFRVTGRAPELWRAETGASEPAPFSIQDGLTTVPLSLAANEAVYVVFRHPAASTTLTLPQAVETPIAALDGPWNIAFEPNRGAPATARLDHLVSWTESVDPGVKHFSGVGVYTRDVTLTAGQLKGAGRLVLDLGDVRDLAEVRVNGVLVAAPWRAPYRADLTDALRPGVNHLEIKVVNTWVNRLIGDKQPGAAKITFTAMPTYRADAPLRPSGLLGPVRLLDIRPRAAAAAP